MASSLLLSLLNVSEDQLSQDAQQILLSVLYDTWSRDEDVEEAWLEALQSAHPEEALRHIRDLLQAPLRHAAQVLQQRTKTGGPHD